MRRHSYEFAWYRFRATFARRWTVYVNVIVLIGLTGGLAMASVAAARRTQSSYPTFLASTHPSTLTMSVFGVLNGGKGSTTLAPAIAQLSDVKAVRSMDSGDAVILNASGAPRLSLVNSVILAGSLDGYLAKQDRLSVLQGHLSNPKSLNQIEVTPGAARLWNVHVGETVPIGFYAPRQFNLPGFGTSKVRPVLTVHARVTAIVAMNSAIVQDDVDRAYGFAFLTPAMTQRAATIDVDWQDPVYYAIQLRHGDRGLARVESQLVRVIPPRYTEEFHVASTVTSTVELAVKPESVALGAFGVIAALVCLILSVQALSRQLRQGNDERRILQSLGASHSDTFAESMIGVFGSVGVGVALAVIVAVALSPLSPLGPVRAVYPDGGLAWDWTVLGLGAFILLAVLGGSSVLIALANSPQRLRAATSVGPRRSVTVRRLQLFGFPLAPTVGAHFALESPRGRGEVPVRSILVGAVLAVTLMTTTLTFSSGLHTLISRPALYGWNWNYMLNPSNNVPPATLRALNHDPEVAKWSGADYTDLTLDGLTVPILEVSDHAQVVPPILSGHGLRNNHEIVLGNQTLALLHKKVGQTVFVSYGAKTNAPIYIPPTPLTIVGTATFPAVGFATSVAEHTSMGTGALIPYGVEPRRFAQALAYKDPNLNGPEMVFVRLRPGVSAAAGKRNLEAIAREANAVFNNDKQAFGNYVTVLGVQRPAQIVDYRSIGATPVLLATGLAAGAVIALALTLIASVRRRRRDLAIMKTLGFTRRMIAAAVAWQATIDGLIGAVIGIPLGILLGRELWTLFARDINAVPQPTVPASAVILVGFGALVVAIIASAWPGRRAATTPAGLVLRSE
ncbi:MAG TPA: FtsX-like permease family protein [Acidimicrobiales bacterium]|nr:FtsX-like permease family protein [Acidimicrobiales bacterium]